MTGLPKLKLARRALLAGLATASLLAMAVGPVGQVLADSKSVIGMNTADEARGWQAVGKLVLGERGFCTGVMIAPQLVLTAAHCLFDKDTGARLRDQTITFQAGWRNGRAEAYRGVRRSVPHPDYVYSGSDELGRVGWDLALLELDQPVQLPQIGPFPTSIRPAPGAAVTVVSYAKDRSEVPSIERNCAVMATEAQALVLTCDIDFGSSGAPVFALSEDGPEVVAVISAKADYNGRKVALAVSVDGPLALLQAELERTRTDRSAKGVRVISGGTADLTTRRRGVEAGATTGGEAEEKEGDAKGGGAKFVRP